MSEKFSKYDDIQLYLKLSGDKSEAESAFAELYARYSQRIFAYCLRILGNNEDARDVFQETFLKFYDSSKTNKQVDNVSGYLIRIARNLCINHKRDSKQNITIDDFQMWTNDIDYERKELLQLLASSLELLDYDYKEAFILRMYQGLSYEEISKITGDSVSAVKNRVWRAKEKIKSILSPYLEDLSN